MFDASLSTKVISSAPQVCSKYDYYYWRYFWLVDYLPALFFLVQKVIFQMLHKFEEIMIIIIGDISNKLITY